jgi:hypothetical protein
MKVTHEEVCTLRQNLLRPWEGRRWMSSAEDDAVFMFLRFLAYNASL